MATPGDGQRTRAWLSRLFVPLLVMMIGGLAITGLLAALFVSNPCTPPDDNKYACLSEAITKLVIGSLIIATGLVITGFFVGRSSRDSGLAYGAVLVVAAILSLSAFVAAELSIPTVFFGLLVPVSIGFGVGGVLRGKATRSPPRDGR